MFAVESSGAPWLWTPHSITRGWPLRLAGSPVSPSSAIGRVGDVVKFFVARPSPRGLYLFGLTRRRTRCPSVVCEPASPILRLGFRYEIVPAQRN